MTEPSDANKPGRLERLRERRRDRRQRRAWRRERRKGVVNPYDSANQAESGMYKGGFFKKD
jgi:hypothetical protein